MSTPADDTLVPRRPLAVDGPPVSVLSLGSWQIWDRIPFDDAVELMRRATAAGINLFDVGHYDQGPHSEGSQTDVLFGRIVEAAGLSRSDYVLGQKLWLWRWPEVALADQLEAALARVGADRADLVVLGDFAGALDAPRLVTEVAELVRAGRAGAWGFNNWAAADVHAVARLARAEGVPAPVLAQLKYSVCRRSVPDGEPYRRVFSELGVGLQASDVFEGGILAGKAQPERKVGIDPGSIREGIRAAAPALAELAAELGATLPQLSLAFCLTHPALTSVLFGTSSVPQLEENLGALQLAAAHGDELRARVEPYWLDRGVVAPDASWGTTREQAAGLERR